MIICVIELEIIFFDVLIECIKIVIFWKFFCKWFEVRVRKVKKLRVVLYVVSYFFMKYYEECFGSF